MAHIFYSYLFLANLHLELSWDFEKACARVYDTPTLLVIALTPLEFLRLHPHLFKLHLTVIKHQLDLANNHYFTYRFHYIIQCDHTQQAFCWKIRYHYDAIPILKSKGWDYLVLVQLLHNLQKIAKRCIAQLSEHSFSGEQGLSKVVLNRHQASKNHKQIFYLLSSYLYFPYFNLNNRK